LEKLKANPRFGTRKNVSAQTYVFVGKKNTVVLVDFTSFASRVAMVVIVP